MFRKTVFAAAVIAAAAGVQAADPVALSDFNLAEGQHSFVAEGTTTGGSFIAESSLKATKQLSLPSLRKTAMFRLPI